MDEKRPAKGQSMSAVAYVDRARGWVRCLEDGEARRSGLVRAEDARQVVARKTGVPVGTLRSLRKNRLKSIAANWYDRLRIGVIRELEAELRRLDHELILIRQTGAHPGSDATAEVLADIQAVRVALGLDGGEAP